MFESNWKGLDARHLKWRRVTSDLTEFHIYVGCLASSNKHKKENGGCHSICCGQENNGKLWYA